MDRLGDLNLINASPVCFQGHVPFCQDIARLSRDSLFDSRFACAKPRGKVATRICADFRLSGCAKGKSSRNKKLRSRYRHHISRRFTIMSFNPCRTRAAQARYYGREEGVSRSWNFSPGMHSGKKSCANLFPDDTIKHLQSESKNKYATPEGFSTGILRTRTKKNLFHSVLFESDYNESL